VKEQKDKDKEKFKRRDLRQICQNICLHDDAEIKYANLSFDYTQLALEDLYRYQ